MDRERWRQIGQILDHALELPAEGLAAYLDETCGEDSQLRGEVESLLAADARSEGLLELPSLGLLTELLDDTEPAGQARLSQPDPTTIDGYRIVGKLGEGGMGSVYEAEQDQPRRRVALKLIKWGMDTRSVLSRFEMERQALGMMSHSNIAQVFDAGATERGRPYFVMELVDGMALVAYCEQHGLELRERLGLFLQVCAGVQHAHQKGVIHRDLKPSNVLVATENGEPVAKIIDFGIAKATGEKLTDKSMYTDLGALIGTPEYMSPEQAATTAVDVDTRTDVYSLGVILYRLIAGALPFDPEMLRQASVAEIQRILREVDPPLPSVRLLSHEGGADSRALAREIRGELDWIVAKALDKDCERRYQTVHDFALDVERYLDHEAVLARPASRLYRVSKFVRRHRVGVAATGLVALALVGGMLAASWGMREAGRQRDEAERQAAVALAVNRFLSRDVLLNASPEHNPDRDITLREVLDRSADRVETSFQDEPAVEAMLRHTIGSTYTALGEHAKAEQHLDAARQIRTELFGVSHRYTLQSANALGVVWQRQGRLAEAVTLFERLVESSRAHLGEEDSLTLGILANLAMVYNDVDRHGDAERIEVELLESHRKVFGNEHPRTIDLINNLAVTYAESDRLEEAEPLMVEALVLTERLQGEAHPHTIRSLGNLCALYTLLQRHEEAELHGRRAMELQRRLLGNDHPNTARTIDNLAVLYNTMERHDEAHPLAREAVEIADRALADGHWWQGVFRLALGNAEAGLGHCVAAEATLTEAHEILSAALDESHPKIHEATQALAQLERRCGPPAAAAR